MADIENIAPATGTAAVRKPSSGSTSSKTVSGSGKRVGSTSGRKTLQTLQPSGKNQKLLVGADGVLRLGSSGSKEVKIYKDPEQPLTSTPERQPPVNKLVQASVAVTSVETQVEDKDTAQARADQILYGAEEDLPLEYWKDLAEKRREALETSLQENEELHTSLSLLEEENQRIQEEKETYKGLAEQAEELAKIINGVVSDSEDEKDEEEDDKNLDDKKENMNERLTDEEENPGDDEK
eukprot:TRINITY_DN20741_c0_g1_i1.p1 TRINITY_DN20741_c0_g1~~TRINITY_DN20741_c0_g1_i1.p1  ORF type:complete len:238 (-),score=96.11 TRINITY_DN20741_c0_g1_i1:327-1040(-)